METSIKVSKKIFNEAYLPMLNRYEKRFEVYYGGAGSGKSVFITQKLIFKYLKYSNRKCLVTRRVGNSLKDSVFALFKTTISDWQLYDRCKINKTDMTIELPNGSQFIFKGLDDEERLKSIAGIDDIWIEEASEIDDFKFDQLCLRLRSRKPYNQIFVSFNPISKANWVYKRWFQDKSNYDESETSILKTTFKDNRFLPQSYIDNLMAMQQNNPAYFRIYALGEFCSIDKLVYTNWEEKQFDFREIIKTNKNVKAVFAIDFGYTNDPTAFVAALIDDVEKIIWVFDEFQQKGMTNKDIAEKVIEMGYRKERITCDSAEPKSIDELKVNGLDRVRPAIKGKDSILNGIQYIQQYKIYVLPKCTCILEELKNYTWIKDKLTGEYINKPIDKWNHGLDSLRYGVVTEAKSISPVITLLDRRLLGL